MGGGGKNIVAFIPARGGSQRLKNKNVRLLAGKPLLFYTIEAAMSCLEISSVIVSTDSEIIRQLAQECGATCPELRSAELSSDTVTVDEVLTQFLLGMEEPPDLVVVLQPTSPFRTASHINKALAIYEQEKALNVVSLTKTKSPINSVGFLEKGLCLDKFLVEGELKDIATTLQPYRLNGAIYIVDTAEFMRRKTLFFNDPNSFAFEMSALDSVDIDTDLDLLWAEFIFQHKK